jgi:hypothetical protein
VGQQDDLGALGRQVVDGRQGGAQAGVVGDLAAVDGHVEVHPDQGALAGEIGGVEGAEGHGLTYRLEGIEEGPATKRRFREKA